MLRASRLSVCPKAAERAMGFLGEGLGLVLGWRSLGVPRPTKPYFFVGSWDKESVLVG